MNWLDIVLIVLGVLALSFGIRVGMFRAVFLLGGLIVGPLLAAQISGPLAEALTDSVDNDSIATVVAYAIVLVGVVLIAQIAGAILRRIASMLFLGWADSLGGGVLGAGAGVLLGIALILAMARFTFLIPESIPGIGERIEVRAALEEALVESTLVPRYIDGADWLPGDTLGLIPGDFESALEELERRIDEEDREDLSGES